MGQESSLHAGEVTQPRSEREDVGDQVVDFIARRGRAGDLLVGQDLVDRRAPEIAMGQPHRSRARAVRVVELQDDLRAVVDEMGRLVGRAVAVAIDRFADPTPGALRSASTLPAPGLRSALPPATRRIDRSCRVDAPCPLFPSLDSLRGFKRNNPLSGRFCPQYIECLFRSMPEQKGGSHGAHIGARIGQ